MHRYWQICWELVSTGWRRRWQRRQCILQKMISIRVYVINRNYSRDVRQQIIRHLYVATLCRVKMSEVVNGFHISLLAIVGTNATQCSCGTYRSQRFCSTFDQFATFVRYRNRICSIKLIYVATKSDRQRIGRKLAFDRCVTIPSRHVKCNQRKIQCSSHNSVVHTFVDCFGCGYL